jgi:hypothetical protein
MGLTNFLFNTFRLTDNAIRPSETPTDGLLSTHKVAGDQASVKIKVPYQNGTVMAYVPLKLVTVANGEIDVVTTGVGAGGDAYVMAFAKSMNLQTGGDCL